MEKSGLEYTVSAESTWKTNVIVYMSNIPNVEENRCSFNIVSAKYIEKIIVVAVYMFSGPTVEEAG